MMVYHLVEGDLTVHGDIDETRAQLLLSIKLRLYHHLQNCPLVYNMWIYFFQSPLSRAFLWKIYCALQDCEEICIHCGKDTFYGRYTVRCLAGV